MRVSMLISVRLTCCYANIVERKKCMQRHSYDMYDIDGICARCSHYHDSDASMQRYTY